MHTRGYSLTEWAQNIVSPRPLYSSPSPQGCGLKQQFNRHTGRIYVNNRLNREQFNRHTGRIYVSNRANREQFNRHTGRIYVSNRANREQFNRRSGRIYVNNRLNRRTGQPFLLRAQGSLLWCDQQRNANGLEQIEWALTYKITYVYRETALNGFKKITYQKFPSQSPLWLFIIT